MQRLSNRETAALLRAVSALYADQFSAPLSARVFQAVKQIAAADWYALDSFHPQGYWLDQSWTEPGTSVSHDDMLAFGHYCHEHPLFTAFIKTGLPQPRKTTDFISTNKFHRLNIYNEFFRRVGTDRQIVCGLPVSKDLTLVLSLNRNRTDFTESHCRQLDALRPHLIAAHKDAAAVARLEFQRAQLRVALEQTGNGVILLDEDGKVQLITAGAERSIAKYFGLLGSSGSGLPDPIERWIAQHRTQWKMFGVLSEPVKALEIRNDEGCLRLRLLVDEERHALVLMEEEVAVSANCLRGLGLTTREAEVLQWLSAGKTNREIATLCDISERTVHKHLEHIYQKLGVETRIAAMQRAVETAKGRRLTSC